MRRALLLAAGLAGLEACNVFGGTPTPPSGFEGWFHVDRPGRATNIAFESTANLAEVRDLGCDRLLNGETPWAADGEAVVLPQWSGAPRFTVDASQQGVLLANPGMYGPAQEQWLSGATCLVCPAGDAGVAVACTDPAVRDGGS